MTWRIYFEETRRSVVADLAQATDENQLADILHTIATSAGDDLDTIHIPHEAVVQAHAVVATAKAWASLASYATTRFYSEGSQQVDTPANQPGGWSRRVASSLLNLSEILGRHLEGAGRTVGAKSVSIGESFPSGLSVDLHW